MLRPAAFMENYYIPAVERALLKGRLLDPIRASTPYQTIATDDIGKFAALAFEFPERFIGVALEIAGSELTNPEAAEVFSRVLGRPVRFRRLPMPGSDVLRPPTNSRRNAPRRAASTWSRRGTPAGNATARTLAAA